MRLPQTFMLAAGLLLAAPLAARQGVPAATPIGKPVDCLRTTDIDETRVRDDRTIDFYTHGRRIYRNVLPQTCPELGFEEAFSYRTEINQLCSVDVIRVLHRSSPVPGVTCGLGKFQPVAIAGKERR